MKKLIKWSFLLVLLFSFNTIVFASVQSPVELLRGVSNHMIAALEQNKSRLGHSDKIIYRIVDNVLVPHIAVNQMAASVVGPRQWKSATSNQRNAFINQFKKLVISTYAAALSSYNGDRVKFYPLRANYRTRNTLTVNSIIIRRSGQRIPVSYNLIRSGSTWKVYDFSIENVSMAQSYRSQFAGVLSQYGMSGLIQRLARHNRANQ